MLFPLAFAALLVLDATGEEVGGIDASASFGESMSSLLSVALGKIGDGAALTFASHEDKIDAYQNIATEDPARFGNQREYFTSIRNSGSDEKDRDGLRTKVSWTQHSCVCLDVFCEETAAIDLSGVRQVDNGEIRGYSPILLRDEDGGTIPCLGHLKLPPIQDLIYQGCSRSSSNGRLVQDCEASGIENLVLVDKDSENIVGVAFDNSFVVPENADIDPESTIVDGTKSFEIPPSVIDNTIIIDLSRYGLNIEVPVDFKYDIAPLLNNALQTVIISASDALGALVRKDDFPPANPASDAKLHEIMRINDYFANIRLVTSASDPTNTTMATIGASSLYRGMVSARPETSPVQEICSGVALISLLSCAVGASFGTILRLGKDSGAKYYLTLSSTLVALIIECVAYSIRWKAEVAQNSYSDAMALVNVAGGGRTTYLPLRIGQDGDVFIATTYVIEVLDASDNYIWIFIFGTVLAAFCLIASTVVGCKYDLGEDQRY